MENITKGDIEEIEYLLDYYKTRILRYVVKGKTKEEQEKYYKTYIKEYNAEFEKELKCAKVEKIYSYASNTEDDRAILRIIKLIDRLTHERKCTYCRYNIDLKVIQLGYAESEFKGYEIQLMEMGKTNRPIAKIKTTLLRR